MNKARWPGPSRARRRPARQPCRPPGPPQAAEDRPRLTRPARPADPAGGTTATGWPRTATRVRGAALRRHTRLAGLRIARFLRPQRPLNSPCDDVRVNDEVLAEQVDYYRRRAGEYDVTAYGDVAAARTRIAGLVEQLRPAGSVLEIACGTGLWTQAL